MLFKTHEWYVETRRAADSNPDLKVNAVTAKLTGDSLYSATLLNRSKHRDVTYKTDDDVNKAINNPRFTHVDVLQESLYEVKSYDLAIQLGVAVYLESKLHMLKFFYNFFAKHLPKKFYSFSEMDTDFLYCALSHKNLDDCVPPEKREDYFRERKDWLPSEACDKHYDW